ncbi:hypothetical protein HID58_007296 [Brassica napus]|uniref:Uncharacterized protein n=1 Tax=Brassica napus TaxID=3708 RepID=A0ABQ8EGU0_BRANA|nr:hypothetical protein HID58_090824 [Brassica napus]KAH0939835.1 hypothetical protein HID58_007296 [Brassica napus]
MEMKTKIVFMVTMLMIGNLIVESEDINKDFQKCFTLCLNICILGPVHDKLGCFGKCGKSCGRQYEIDRVNFRWVSAQDPSKKGDRCEEGKRLIVFRFGYGR